MTLPSQNISFLNGQLGAFSAGTDTPLFVGPCSLGVANTRYSFGNIGQLVSTLGVGPVVDDAAQFLSLNGGTVDVIVSAASVASQTSTVTSSSIGSAIITVSGTPLNDYSVVGTIVTAGALGTSTVSWSLDGGETFTPAQFTTGSLVLDDSGLTVTMASHTYAAGETFSFTASCATMNATDQNAAMAVYVGGTVNNSMVIVSNDPLTSAEGATLAAAMNASLLSARAKFNYTQAIMNMGGRTEAWSTREASYASFASDLVSIVSARARCTIATSSPGRANPHVHGTLFIGAAAGARDIASSFAAVAFGSLPGVSEPVYDEFLEGERENLIRVVGLRTFPGFPGIYATQSWLKSASLSDFKYLENARLIHRAAQIVVQGQWPYINANVLVTKIGPNTGKIDPVEASNIEGPINAALVAALLEPQDDFGRNGLANDVIYSVDRSNNVKLTETLRSSVQVQSKGKVLTIDTSVSLVP